MDSFGLTSTSRVSQKKDKLKVSYEGSKKPFRFTDAKQFVSSKATVIPSNIIKLRVRIRENIDSNIPLFLPKATMKNGQIGLNFCNDTNTFLGDKNPLYETRQRYCFKSIIGSFDSCGTKTRSITGFITYLSVQRCCSWCWEEAHVPLCVFLQQALVNFYGEYLMSFPCKVILQGQIGSSSTIYLSYLCLYNNKSMPVDNN